MNAIQILICELKTSLIQNFYSLIYRFVSCYPLRKRHVSLHYGRWKTVMSTWNRVAWSRVTIAIRLYISTIANSWDSVRSGVCITFKRTAHQLHTYFIRNSHSRCHCFSLQRYSSQFMVHRVSASMYMPGECWYSCEFGLLCQRQNIMIKIYPYTLCLHIYCDTDV